MTTTTDDSLDISAQLFWQSATPTSSATQTRNIPVPHPIFREIFKLIFPGAPVKPNHIKPKLRWLQETYYKEKKLLLTGAGMLLEDMDASNPSNTSRLALSTKYAWFEKMHEMMNGRSSAKPATLIMTPSCHGPECTGSKKAVGSYGRSISVRDQADPQKSRPWQAMV
ncbi:uncharacterized protein UHOD_11674 [Ustilago sp. UG-2017b]|nr:uncharacterized protein UHOD_11674 [Ustilago sp. UG-2017b]